MKPGQPGNNQGRGGFVICEICDGYIKDLEQLRNHMQWIHKVTISMTELKQFKAELGNFLKKVQN